MKNFLLIVTCLFLCAQHAWAQTPITNAYFSANLSAYVWDIAGSPYIITEDIKIPASSNLNIEPGVKVLFEGRYKMDVFGSLNAIGNQNHRIKIHSYNSGDHWRGIRFLYPDGSNPPPSSLHFCDISQARKSGTTCSSPDPESSGGAIYVQNLSNLEITECNIFDNHVQAQGGAIFLFQSSSYN